MHFLHRTFTILSTMASILSKSSGMERSWSKDVLRIVCISDTHSMELRMQDIPAGDVLVHAGDFSSTGRLEEMTNFRSFIDSLPHAQKIVIAGNHDITMETDYYVNSPHGGKRFHSQLFRTKTFDPVAYSKQCRTLIEASNYPEYSYLEDSSCQLFHPVENEPTDLTVYGAPWQPEFYDWAYNLPIGPRLREKWDQIPAGVDVLITHGPPLTVLDRAPDGHQCGCPDLWDTVTSRVKPRMHIFGHIHDGHGTQTDGTTLFVNACTCTEEYKPTNPPIVIDLPLDRSLPPIVVDWQNNKMEL